MTFNFGTKLYFSNLCITFINRCIFVLIRNVCFLNVALRLDMIKYNTKWVFYSTEKIKPLGFLLKSW